MEAFLWGLASAVSLPIGAALGLWWRPGARLTATFMAFGAGALLFALTVELMAHVPELAAEQGGALLAVAAGGALAGGLLFDLLNQILNNRGAFLRNLSNTKDFVVRTKRTRARRWLRRLARIEALAQVPRDDLAELLSRVCKEHYRDGEVIFGTGDAVREVHFIRRGHVDLIAESDGGEQVLARLGPNETFGEIGLMEGRPRSATARAVGGLELYTLDRADLDELADAAPSVANAIETLARSARLRPDAEDDVEPGTAAVAGDHLETLKMPVTGAEIRAESQRASQAAGVALAIWLGIGIDALPESVVIGTLAIGPQGMSLAFIAGVFLANLPESMSSAVSMRANRMRTRTILLMWSSLCLLTGLGAGAGALLFPPDPHGPMLLVKTGIEGLAAGAMLTMIAETMLPEAFEQGGSIIGLATLCGFLAALLVAAV